MRGLLPIIIACLFSIQLNGQGITIDPEVRMLALGDSYTIGQSVALEERWPQQFVAELRKMGVKAPDPVYIATTGWTTKNLLDGMDSKLDTTESYNLVSILIGVNNQYQGIDITTYEPELEEIIQRALRIAGHDPGRVFMLSIPDYAYTPYGNGRRSISEGIDAYNSINNRVAATYGIPYVDVTAISREGLVQPELVAEDGLHPSGIQYGAWVEGIMPFLVTGNIQSNASQSLQKDEGVTIRIFPNPTTASILIHADQQMESYGIRDSRGSLLERRILSGNPLLLDLSHLGPGIYFLEVATAQSRVTRSFILN